MRISVKGRYALAASAVLAEDFESGSYLPVINLSQQLGISKIYLEQVFSLLKRGGVVVSVKGAQGGYRLARKPDQITLRDVLSPVEQSLFEPFEETVRNAAPALESVLFKTVFEPLNRAVNTTLDSVTLADMVSAVEKERHGQGGAYMFYI